MAVVSPMKNLIDLSASTCVTAGSTIRLTVECRSKLCNAIQHHESSRHVTKHDRLLEFAFDLLIFIRMSIVHIDLSCLVQPSILSTSIHNDTLTRTPLDTNRMDSRQSVDKPTDRSSTGDRTSMERVVSEDEKSTSSEEVVFEEWNEEFRCRRMDEFDGHTNRLVRTSINETSERIKGDVIKEEYKERHRRVKGQKTSDLHRRSSMKQQADRTVHRNTEETSSSPHRMDTTALSSTNRDEQQWSTEEKLIVDIVYDTDRTGHAAHDDHVHSSLKQSDRIHSRLPPDSIIDLSFNPDQHKSKPDDIISEEYQVELEQRSTSNRHREKIDGNYTFAYVRFHSIGYISTRDEINSRS
jgi:hypothetical protein